MDEVELSKYLQSVFFPETLEVKDPSMWSFLKTDKWYK